LTAGLQVQNYKGELNPNNHKAQDTIDHMNLDYWFEQIKATVAIAAQLVVPIPVDN
jgi:hypothetical protein